MRWGVGGCVAVIVILVGRGGCGGCARRILFGIIASIRRSSGFIPPRRHPRRPPNFILQQLLQTLHLLSQLLQFRIPVRFPPFQRLRHLLFQPLHLLGNDPAFGLAARVGGFEVAEHGVDFL